MTWVAAWVAVQAALLRSRRGPASVERAPRAVLLEHAAFVIVLTSGWAAMAVQGWRLDHPRWLAVKIGLVLFLFVPLEGFHAFVRHVWLPGALRSTSTLRERQIERGRGMEDMVRTLATPLYAAAIPLILWLAWKRPF